MDDFEYLEPDDYDVEELTEEQEAALEQWEEDRRRKIAERNEY